MNKSQLSRTLKNVVKHRWLYIFLIPSIVYLIIFKYIPIMGNIIAFKDYSVGKGIFGSDWVGLEHFKFIFFESNEFWRIFRNTIIITVYRLIWTFPIPIMLALMLNEVKVLKFKKVSQTIMYLPHFISWVVVAGMVQFLFTSDGPVNMIVQMFGGEPIRFLQSSSWFRSILVGSDLFKTAGYSSVIYFAALSGIDGQLYEAARIDGANRLKQILYVTIPGIMPTAVIVLILNVGRTIRVGFEQVLLLYNPTVYEVGDILQTYIYRTGLSLGRFSYSTAIGLFESLIALTLILSTNWIAKKFREEGGLW